MEKCENDLWQPFNPDASCEEEYIQPHLSCCEKGFGKSDKKVMRQPETCITLDTNIYSPLFLTNGMGL